MPTRIDKLPSELDARLPAIRDEWIAIGLSTEPADRPAAEAAADLAYKVAGMVPPKIKIWLRSPLEGAIGAAMLSDLKVGAQVRAQVGAQVRAQVWAQVGAQVGAQVRAQVWAQVRAQVGAQVWAQVWDQVRAQVRAQVWAQVWDQVRAQVRAQVWAQVRAQVRAQVWAQVGDQVWDQVWAQVRDQVWAQVGDQVWDQVGAQVWAQVRDQVYRAGYGLHDAAWVSFYSVFGGLVSAVDELAGLTGLAKSCGWYWPFAGAIILTERPSRISRDDENRLHSANGPALAYPDGFSLWRIGGVVVDEQIVMSPETQTVAQIRAEPNAEVKRIRIDRFGWEKYLKQIKAVVLDVHRNDIEATKEALMRTPDGETVLVVGCPSTTRTYALEVPPGIANCLEAQSWLSGGLSSRVVNAS